LAKMVLNGNSQHSAESSVTDRQTDRIAIAYSTMDTALCN